MALVRGYRLGGLGLLFCAWFGAWFLALKAGDAVTIHVCYTINADGFQSAAIDKAGDRLRRNTEYSRSSRLRHNIVEVHLPADLAIRFF